MGIDLLISGGTVADGTGNEPYLADVAIKDGRICDIGSISGGADHATLDARGLYVAPGFIDVHSHSDFTLVVDPRAVSSITQGVTCEIIGNCGHGCAPALVAERTKSNIYGYDEEYGINWTTMSEYLETLETRQPAVNLATLVPNGNLRLSVVGFSDRPADSDEIRKMCKLLEQSLEEGAIGYSTGLEYPSENACSEEEITALCKVTARAGGIYATHTRNIYGQARETIDEAIRASEAAGVPLQISHIGVVARLAENSREVLDQAMAQVAEAKARGAAIGFDMHTRGYGIAKLSAVLPNWVLQEGRLSLRRRLQDLSSRETLKTSPNFISSVARGRWDKILLFDCKSQPELTGRSIAEIAKMTGVSPLDAIYNILLWEIDRIHELLVINATYDAHDLRVPFYSPDCMVGSDATALATDGPLKDKSFHGAYTWAAWFFNYFVREQKVLSAQEAIRRMTSLPAAHFGIQDRGVLRRGAWADISILDPERFAERGTVFEPNQVAEGMVHVLVNGIPAVKDAQVTSNRGGQVLRRR